MMDERTTGTISCIIERIRDRRKGQDWTNNPWTIYSLDPKGYQELLRSLQGDESVWGYVEDKLRYDYFPSVNRFVLRMPTTLHEELIRRIVYEIEDQLKSVPGESAKVAKNIKPRGSVMIKAEEEEYGTHHPDAQFRHSEESIPGVVIEVSYFQKRKYLPDLADDYILGSDANIRVVVGIDIDYQSGKKATLSVWRPDVVTNDAGEKILTTKLVVANQVFRDSSGRPSISPTGDLRLRLRDFAETYVGFDLELNDELYLPAQMLCSFLDQAESAAFVVSNKTGRVLTKRFKKKRRTHTWLPEEIIERAEKRLRAKENKAEGQTNRDDSSFKTGSTSEGEAS